MSRIVDRYPLTPMQLGMLFQHLSSRQPGTDIEQILCTLREPLDSAALRRAWERVVERHPAFRTSFRWEDVDDPVQEVHEQVRLPWEEKDYAGLPSGEREALLERALREDRSRGFRPDEAPLMRVAVHRFGPEDCRIVWTFHHLLLDGRSFPVVLRELFARYEGERVGRPVDFPAPRPFRDHVEKLRGGTSREGRDYWTRYLAGFASPTPLPGARSSGAPPEVRECATRLPEPETTVLRRLADAEGLTLGTFIQGTWGLLLARHAGLEDVVFGATRACRRSSVEGAEDMVGLFINTLPVRVRIDEKLPVLRWLKDLRADQRGAWPFEQTPLTDIQSCSELTSGTPLFESLLVYDRADFSDLLRAAGGPWSNRTFELVERTGFPLTLYATGGSEARLRLAYDAARFDDETANRLLEGLRTVLGGIGKEPNRPLGTLDVLGPRERRRLLVEWNATGIDRGDDACVHQLIERQVRGTPGAAALASGERTLTYEQLDRRANRLAHSLRSMGVGPDVRVGVFLERSEALVTAVLGVLKAGGAYVPLDPAFPHDRIAFMLQDAAVPVVLTNGRLRPRLPATTARIVEVDGEEESGEAPTRGPATEVRPENLVYVIYTSGSTGRPKGVMVEHRNVVSFFAGMDARIPCSPPGVWLAVTSLSFDISVLELLWTLARGFKVVLAPEQHHFPAAPRAGGVTFSLFYFAADEGEKARDKYRLLLEGAKFADRNGFEAVWTPERHFHAFGGLYPNPAVAGAALAALTERIRIRAGSVVLPLHHPARVAEEWALVDNLSGGRVGVSFASGWQPADFALRPEAYDDRHEAMYRGIETVRRLWRGEAVEYPGPDGKPVPIRTRPKPVQKELPVWVTTAGSVHTWRRAGEIGASVLTHLLGQTVEELREKIRIYREAWSAHGHPAGRARVTLMIHTFVGEDPERVRETVRGPMTEYLGSALSLVKSSAAAWTAFKKRSDGTAPAPDVDLEKLAPEEREDLLAFSFERYFKTSGLFGTPERCAERVAELQAAGVNEIACLIDFGVDSETVLEHLPLLHRVVSAAGRPAAAEAVPVPDAGDESSIGRLIERHGVTHLQCTPSMASMLLQDDGARGALKRLSTLMIGGEAFPRALAQELGRRTDARLLNMYGPTETAIWSSTHPVDPAEETVPIGRPIASTRFYVVDRRLRPVPLGAVGELLIGGPGVVRGYLNRPELTAERFLPDRFGESAEGRLYRTGDLVRYRPDGVLEFLGREDHQVKIRGHRIELGEVEATLAEHAGVRDVAVVAREFAPNDQRLLAYVVAAPGASPDEEGLRRGIREKLPEYMVPSRFLFLDAMPMTPNLKIDRKALPLPKEGAPRSDATGHAPPTDVERRILDVWNEVLGISDAGPTDNFFDLGGHSLLAVRAHRRLKEEFQRDLAITDLFRYPTVRALAAYLGDGDGDGGSGLEEARERADRRRDMIRRRRPAGRGARGPGAGDEPT